MADDTQNRNGPRFARVASKATTSATNLAAGGAGLLAGAALHSWAMLALGGVAYGALVAWDLASPAFWKKALADKAPHKRIAPATLRSPEVRAALERVIAADREMQRVMAYLPGEVQAHFAAALVPLEELREHARQLAQRADELGAYLVSLDLVELEREHQGLLVKARGSADGEARRQYESAAAARAEKLRAVEDIHRARERALAGLSRVAATLDGMPAQFVRAQAMDAQAMDALSFDLNEQLDHVNSEVRSVEQTLRALEVRAA